MLFCCVNLIFGIRISVEIKKVRLSFYYNNIIIGLFVSLTPVANNRLIYTCIQLTPVRHIAHLTEKRSSPILLLWAKNGFRNTSSSITHQQMTLPVITLTTLLACWPSGLNTRLIIQTMTSPSASRVIFFVAYNFLGQESH